VVVLLSLISPCICQSYSRVRGVSSSVPEYSGVNSGGVFSSEDFGSLSLTYNGETDKGVTNFVLPVRNQGGKRIFVLPSNDGTIKASSFFTRRKNLGNPPKSIERGQKANFSSSKRTSFTTRRRKGAGTNPSKVDSFSSTSQSRSTYSIPSSNADMYSSTLKTQYEGLRGDSFYPNFGTNEPHDKASGRNYPDTKTISSLSKKGGKTSSLRSSSAEYYPGQINGRRSKLSSNRRYGANPIDAFKSEGTSNVGKLSSVSSRFRCIIPAGERGREVCF